MLIWSRSTLLLSVILIPVVCLLFLNYRHLLHPNRSISDFPTDVVNLTRTLVSIPSESGHEQSLFKYVHQWLVSHNLTVIQQPVSPLSETHPPRSNLLAHHPSVSLSQISVIFCTHLDTVPGQVQPPSHTHSSAQNRLYGRGSVDAKGQAASMLLATITLRHPQVAILLVCGEETDHAGMLVAHQLNLPSVTLINGEPTEGRFATYQKGMIKARISTKGVAAHSGYPHLGHSALHTLIDLLHQLRTHDWGQDVTLNVGIVSGGKAPNVLADSAYASLMWRITSKVSPILEKAREIVASYPQTHFEVITSNDAVSYFVPPRSGLITGNTTVAYNTDVPYYKGNLNRVILLGAGSIHQAHTKDEYIQLDDLRRLPPLLMQVARELLNESVSIDPNL